MARVLSVFLVAVTALGARGGEETPRADSGPRFFGEGPALRYVVLGDSTAVAVGGDYENGLAVGTARHLASAGRRVELINVAVSGARIHDVLVEQLPRVDLSGADVVLVDVGANDVIRMTRSGSFDRDFQRVLESIRAQSPKARIVVTGSADMGSPPRIPRLLRPLATFRTQRLNAIVRRHAARYGLTFAPIAERTGPLFRRDRSLFADDRFHPNDRGYATWTAVINEALDRALDRALAE